MKIKTFAVSISENGVNGAVDAMDEKINNYLKENPVINGGETCISIYSQIKDNIVCSVHVKGDVKGNRMDP